MAVLAASTILAWAWLLVDPATPAGAICGDAAASQWMPSLARWLAMSVAMGLPAALRPVLAARRRADAVPLAFAASFGAALLASGAGGAVGQQFLVRLGAFDPALPHQALAALALILAGTAAVARAAVGECVRTSPRDADSHAPTGLHGLLLGCGSLRCCLVMVCLAILSPVHGAAGMTGLMLCMALEAALPWKRTLSALSGVALAAAGGLSLAALIL